MYTKSSRFSCHRAARKDCRPISWADGTGNLFDGGGGEEETKEMTCKGAVQPCIFVISIVTNIMTPSPRFYPIFYWNVKIRYYVWENKAIFFFGEVKRGSIWNKQHFSFYNHGIKRDIYPDLAFERTLCAACWKSHARI